MTPDMSAVPAMTADQAMAWQAKILPGPTPSRRAPGPPFPARQAEVPIRCGAIASEPQIRFDTKYMNRTREKRWASCFCS
jgi:hypothetical protein